MIREYVQTAGKMWTGQARTEAYGTVVGVVPDLQDLDDLCEGMSLMVTWDIQLMSALKEAPYDLESPIYVSVISSRSCDTKSFISDHKNLHVTFNGPSAGTQAQPSASIGKKERDWDVDT
jgi:hypothetical protein